MGVKGKNLPYQHNPLGISLAWICLNQKSEHFITISVSLVAAAISQGGEGGSLQEMLPLLTVSSLLPCLVL